MMQQHSASSSVRRGEIVWARVEYPHRWFPALVLGSDNLGVSVSFFNLNTFYFVESEVLPFEETFRSIMNLHNNNSNNNKCDEIFYALLQSALKLLGQRVIFSLSCRCRCQKKGFSRKVVDASSTSSYCFDPIGVLGFVLNVAVLPSVDAADSVDAVKLVAQIHAFRGYSTIQQKKVYRETPKTGDVMKLHPCSSLGQKMHLVTQESVDSEPKDEYQIISKEGGRNMAIDAIGKRRRLDKPALYGFSFTRQRILYFSSISKALAWMQRTKSGKKKDNSGAFISSPALANQACICSSKTTINFTDGVQNLTLQQQSFACESLSNIVLGFHSDTSEVDASAAIIKGMLGSNSYVYHKRLQIRSNDEATPLKSEKSERTKLSSGDCLVEVKDQYQCVASCSIFNSKVGQISKTHVPICSTSLYIKFPKNFNLPSKGELIKKFNVFGSVDSSKTRVFCYSGSARVAFFHEADAVAAHLYAKKKKVPFGVANVRFWCDPLENRRGGFKRFALMSPSASKPIGPPLKSCLKKSHSLRQENEKKHHRVRFTIET